MTFRSSRRALAVAALLCLSVAAPASAQLLPEHSVPDATKVAGYAREVGVTTAEAASHLALQARGAGMVDELRTALGGDFAGVWFDNDRGRFHVGLVAGADRGAVARIVAQHGLEADTDLDDVRFTWDELAAAETGVVRRIGVYGPQQRARVGLDVARNALRVDVSDDAAARDVATMRAAAPGDVPLRIVRVAHAALEDAPAACVFPDCDHPLRGGVLIGNDGSSPRSCTAGALATRGADLFIVTAGHCISNGGNWYARQATGANPGAWHVIGPSGGWFVDGSRGDAGAINVSRSSWWMQTPWVPMTAAWNVDLAHGTSAISAGYPGEFTCHFGITTGNPLDASACGITTQMGITTFYAGIGNVGPLDLNTACTLPGDSGGPVIDGFTLVGFVSGSNSTTGCQPDHFTLFEEAPNAAAWLGGLTLKTL